MDSDGRAAGNGRMQHEVLLGHGDSEGSCQVCSQGSWLRKGSRSSQNRKSWKLVKFAFTICLSLPGPAGRNERPTSRQPVYCNISSLIASGCRPYLCTQRAGQLFQDFFLIEMLFGLPTGFIRVADTLPQILQTRSMLLHHCTGGQDSSSLMYRTSLMGSDCCYLTADAAT